MATGRKTGGRKAGTPNRKSQTVNEILESLGCNPIEGMATIAGNAGNPPELRGRMYAELAQYVYPKRKAIEHTGPGAEPQAHKLEVVFVSPPDCDEENSRKERIVDGVP
jgi:hypothetical protein